MCVCGACLLNSPFLLLCFTHTYTFFCSLFFITALFFLPLYTRVGIVVDVVVVIVVVVVVVVVVPVVVVVAVVIHLYCSLIHPSHLICNFIPSFAELDKSAEDYTFINCKGKYKNKLIFENTVFQTFLCRMFKKHIKVQMYLGMLLSKIMLSWKQIYIFLRDPVIILKNNGSETFLILGP